MANEVKEQEPPLKTYTFYSLLTALGVSVFMIVWHFIRMGQSGKNDVEISWMWSLIHIIAYIVCAVATGLGLYGVWASKSQFLSWFLSGTVPVVIAELVCVLWNQFIISDKNKQFSIIVVILKVLAIVVIITSIVFVSLWKRSLDNQTINTSEKAADKQANTKTKA